MRRVALLLALAVLWMADVHANERYENPADPYYQQWLGLAVIDQNSTPLADDCPFGSPGIAAVDWCNGEAACEFAGFSVGVLARDISLESSTSGGVVRYFCDWTCGYLNPTNHTEVCEFSGPPPSPPEETVCESATCDVPMPPCSPCEPCPGPCAIP